MAVLDAFIAILEDLNLKFSQGEPHTYTLGAEATFWLCKLSCEK